MLGAIQDGGDFASSAVVGLLYTVASPVIGFAYAAAWTLVALAGSVALRTLWLTRMPSGELRRPEPFTMASAIPPLEI